MKNNQKGFSGILIIIILALVIGSGVFMYQKNKMAIFNQKIDSIVATSDKVDGINMPGEIDAIKPSIDVTKEQKEYVNIKYKFSFKYPSTGVDLLENTSGDISEFSLALNFPFLKTSTTAPSIGIIASGPIPDSLIITNLSALRQRIALENKNNPEFIEVREVKFGKNTFVEMTTRSSGDTKEISKTYFYQKGRFEYSIRNNYLDSNTFGSVISTFSFN